jgi:hypothetical protein
MGGGATKAFPAERASTPISLHLQLSATMASVLLKRNPWVGLQHAGDELRPDRFDGVFTSPAVDAHTQLQCIGVKYLSLSFSTRHLQQRFLLLCIYPCLT